MDEPRRDKEGNIMEPACCYAGIRTGSQGGWRGFEWVVSSQAACNLFPDKLIIWKGRSGGTAATCLA